MEYATTRLMSFWMMPRKPMNKAVMAPTTKTRFKAVSDNSKKGDIRDTMKMPAVTMVAAWIKAEIGVGPSMESGNQTWSGNWADLPIAPMNRQIQITVSKDHEVPGSVSGTRAWVWANTSV